MTMDYRTTLKTNRDLNKSRLPHCEMFNIKNDPTLFTGFEWELLYLRGFVIFAYF